MNKKLDNFSRLYFKAFIEKYILEMLEKKEERIKLAKKIYRKAINKLEKKNG